MKRPFIILSFIAVLMAACGGNNESTEQTTSYSPPPATTSAEPTAAAAKSAGETLIAKSDCIGCHRVDRKMIGPAYQDIAAKYPATPENIDAVASRVIKGSKGIWGSVPMTPHDKISEADAKEIVKYILSLKK